MFRQLPNAPEARVKEKGQLISSIFDRDRVIEEFKYQPWEIRFRILQVAGLLIYLELITIGQWPFDLRDSSHVQRSHHAYFETVSEVVAELESRLKATDRDGAMCVLYYTKEVPEATIAQVSQCDIRDVGRRISLAMKYMSGWQRKRVSYEEFVKHRRYKGWK